MYKYKPCEGTHDMIKEKNNNKMFINLISRFYTLERLNDE